MMSGIQLRNNCSKSIQGLRSSTELASRPRGRGHPVSEVNHLAEIIDTDPASESKSLCEASLYGFILVFRWRSTEYVEEADCCVLVEGSDGIDIHGLV